jgi:predicted alpha/beta hydrolase
MRQTAVQIPSRDGFLLGALLMETEGDAKGVIQLAGGTGIKKEFYFHFASFLCEHNYHVLIFDYRGIGSSRPASLRGFKAFLHEWGQKDMAAVLDWLDEKFPQLKKYLVGHSAGGQQIGFMDNYQKFSKGLLISSATGYWGWLSSPYKYSTLFIWYVLAPLTITTVGYLPASWFKLGEDLPKGIANEWRRWCLSKHYFKNDLESKISPHYFDQVKMPLHFLFPEDDIIATDRTVHSLKSFYPQAATTVEKILLKDYSMKQIGHIGFFSRKSKEKLWGKALTFLESIDNSQINQ